MSRLDLGLGPLMIDIDGLKLTADDQRRLQDPSVGGLILFSRNFQNREQLTALTCEVKALRSPALLIAVDQEGGRVQRFKNSFTRFPPMAAFGQLYDACTATQQDILANVRLCGHLLAQELIECGIDISFAPVLDLGHHEQTVIGDRAFHADPTTLILLADAFIDGLNAAGMQATGKHFPGHGNVLADSHHTTPEDPRPLCHIEAQDMQPFIALKDKLGAMMTAHINYIDVDDGCLPTYSKQWLLQILRQKIGFQGLIFSDDLSMCGARIVGGLSHQAEQALSAGCDMVLVCNNPGGVDSLINNRRWRASIQSQRRIKAMKASFGEKLSRAQISQIQRMLRKLTNKPAK